MTILEFIAIVIYGVVCYKTGWIAREIVAKKAVDKMMAEAESEDAYEDEDIVRVYFEKEQGNIFVYNYETDEFIAQGNTKESAIEAMVQRYPRTKFIVEKEILESL